MEGSGSEEGFSEEAFLWLPEFWFCVRAWAISFSRAEDGFFLSMNSQTQWMTRRFNEYYTR